MNKSYRTDEKTSSVQNAIENAMSEIESLKEEMEENRDNAPNDELGQKWGDVADELSGVTLFQEEQLNSELGDLECSYPELSHRRKGRGLSRNARAALEGALLALENCDIDGIKGVEQDELDEAISHVQEIVDSLPEVEFPTMFG